VETEERRFYLSIVAIVLGAIILLVLAGVFLVPTPKTPQPVEIYFAELYRYDDRPLPHSMVLHASHRRRVQLEVSSHNSFASPQMSAPVCVDVRSGIRCYSPTADGLEPSLHVSNSSGAAISLCGSRMCYFGPSWPEVVHLDWEGPATPVGVVPHTHYSVDALCGPAVVMSSMSSVIVRPYHATREDRVIAGRMYHTWNLWGVRAVPLKGILVLAGRNLDLLTRSLDVIHTWPDLLSANPLPRTLVVGSGFDRVLVVDESAGLTVVSLSKFDASHTSRADESVVDYAPAPDGWLTLGESGEVWWWSLDLSSRELVDQLDESARSIRLWRHDATLFLLVCGKDYLEVREYRR